MSVVAILSAAGIEKDKYVVAALVGGVVISL
jgi:hypothetical protein